MKTTVDIRDDLLERARKRARSDRTTLRALLESALEAQLAHAPKRRRRQPQIQVFDAPKPVPGTGLDWSRMKEMIYAERETRIVRGCG